MTLVWSLVLHKIPWGINSETDCFLGEIPEHRVRGKAWEPLDMIPPTYSTKNKKKKTESNFVYGRKMLEKL